MLAGGLHLHIDAVADAHLGGDRLGRGNAQAKKVDLSDRDDGKAAGLRGARLHQGAGIGEAPGHNPVIGSGDVGVAIQRRVVLQISLGDG